MEAVGGRMLMLALAVFVVLPLAGAAVLGAVLLLERSPAQAQAPAGSQPAVRAPARDASAAAPQQGLVAGLVARVTNPELARLAAWAKRSLSSGSQPRVVSPR
jgi:hypothetical protein